MVSVTSALVKGKGRPRDKTCPSPPVAPSSPAPSIDPPSCFACAPMSSSNIKPHKLHTTANTSHLPTPPSTPSSPSLVQSQSRRSTLLPRTGSLRQRISIRPSVALGAGSGSGKNPPSQPVSITLAIDHPHVVAPSSLSPLDHSDTSRPSSPPPPSAYWHRNSTTSRRSSTDEDDDPRTRKGSVHKAAAERILKGHRKPPQPPTTPRPLLATLMATVPVAGGEALAPPSTAQPKKDPDELAQGPKRQSSSGSSTDPIDVREELSKCADPSMAWSMQFWVTIADPLVRVEANPIPRAARR
jgi:hypothetical protein